MYEINEDVSDDELKIQFKRDLLKKTQLQWLQTEWKKLKNDAGSGLYGFLRQNTSALCCALI